MFSLKAFFHGNSENMSIQSESTARVKIKMDLRNMYFLLVIILSLKIQVEIYFGCFFCYFNYLYEIVVHVCGLMIPQFGLLCLATIIIITCNHFQL